MNVVTAKAATCTADGINWHVECENCGNWYWDIYGSSLIADHSKLITKAYGHKWSEWEVVKAATETEEGLKERHCYNNAAHKEQETIPKLEPAPTEPTTEEHWEYGPYGIWGLTARILVKVRDHGRKEETARMAS